MTAAGTLLAGNQGAGWLVIAVAGACSAAQGRLSLTSPLRGTSMIGQARGEYHALSNRSKHTQAHLDFGAHRAFVRTFNSVHFSFVVSF